VADRTSVGERHREPSGEEAGGDGVGGAEAVLDRLLEQGAGERGREGREDEPDRGAGKAEGREGAGVAGDLELLAPLGLEVLGDERDVRRRADRQQLRGPVEEAQEDRPPGPDGYDVPAARVRVRRRTR
jgi:hypothetical protein